MKARHLRVSTATAVIALLSIAGMGTAQAASPATDAYSTEHQPPAEPQAPARTASQPANEDATIVVTGSRLRQESLQDVPIAVTVTNAAQIQDLHSSDIRGLSNLVPNLTISQLPAGTGVSIISLRGFATSSANIEVEPGIAVYIDGVYQTTTLGSLNDFFDLDRVEVLRGPQGTLLGKNASAGAILLTRSRPTGEFGGMVHFEYGTYNLAQVQGVLNFPIVPGVLAGKIFGSYRYRGDWQRNVVFPGRDSGGEDRQTVRGALLFTPVAVDITPDHLDYFYHGRRVSARPSQTSVSRP